MALRDQCTARLVKLCRPSRSCRIMPARPGRPPCCSGSLRCGNAERGVCLRPSAPLRGHGARLHRSDHSGAGLRLYDQTRIVRGSGPEGHSGTCPKSHAAKGRYGHRLEGHGRIRGMACGMAGRAGQAALVGSWGSSEPHGFRRLRLGSSPRRGRWPCMHSGPQAWIFLVSVDAVQRASWVGAYGKHILLIDINNRKTVVFGCIRQSKIHA